MALMMECDECEHVQSVGMIENGLPGGYADPHQKCEKCGTTGRYSAPGAKKRLQEQMQSVIVALTDPKVIEMHKQLATMFPKDQ